MKILSLRASVAAAPLAVFIASLSAGTALAQDAVREEQEVVVTAPLEGSRLESLQGAEVLRREDIVAQLNGGLGDTLDATPGISTTFFGAGASRPIIRGLGEDRVRVLQNGIGAIDASTASPDHAVTSDGLDAERIEVLRGAAALAYGGNAIGGVVNVVDQSIPTRAIDGVEFSGLAAYSSVDEGTQGSGDLGFGAGPFALRLNASARQTNAYDTPIGEAANQWTDMRAYSAGGAVVQDWGFAGLAVKRTEDEYGLLPEGAGEPGGHIELEQTRIEARGDVRLQAGIFDRLDFGAQRSEYEHTEFEGDGEPGTRFFSEGWEARAEAHHRGEFMRGAIGAQVSDVDFSAEGDEAFITATNTRDVGVFGLERYDTGRWGLEGGLRFERRDIENETFGARQFDNANVSLGAFTRPAENWFVGATVAHTERAPTAIELFSDGPHLATANFELGDPALTREEALSFEVSARYERGPLRFEINLFHVDFADYIALVERGDVWWLDEDTDTSGFAADEASAPAGADEVLPVFSFVQQDATFTGGEISAAAQFFEMGGFAIGGDVSLDLVEAEFDGGGHPPRIPPRALTLGLTAQNAVWRGRVEAVETAEQDRLAPFETATDGYTFVNAGLSYRPGGEDGAWTIRLDGRNLTDELGRVHSSFLKDDLPLPGRNVRLTVTTEF
jgi:iron complex outermembrane recepter protein